MNKLKKKQVCVVVNTELYSAIMAVSPKFAEERPLPESVDPDFMGAWYQPSAAYTVRKILMDYFGLVEDGKVRRKR